MKCDEIHIDLCKEIVTICRLSLKIDPIWNSLMKSEHFVENLSTKYGH